MKKEKWEEIQELASKSLNGDQAAYELFLTEISNYLKLKIRYSIPQDSREDVLQEILMAIHASLKTLEVSRPVKPWVNAIAHYKVSDFLRSHYKKSNQVSFEEEMTLIESISTVENKLMLEKILIPLTEFERKVILLLKYNGESIEDVSKSLGKSESNIKIICFRALKKMREILAKEEFYGN